MLRNVRKVFKTNLLSPNHLKFCPMLGQIRTKDYYIDLILSRHVELPSPDTYSLLSFERHLKPAL